MGPSSSDLVAGQRIGGFVTLQRLAVGGMAEVYLARQEGPRGFTKKVVIKRILPDLARIPKFVEMFLDEGRLVAQLSHPNIAQTFELGEQGGQFHLVMEYVPGESLSQVVGKSKSEKLKIPEGAALRIIAQVLDALEYAHEMTDEAGMPLGLIHRDITPSNLILTAQGGVKLIDFGIARSEIQEHRTEVGMVKGKGGFLSPEQATAGPVDLRADLYSVGVILYLLLTQVGPFDDYLDAFSKLKASSEGRFPKPSKRDPNVSPHLEAIILKAMSVRADDRYQSAAEMQLALEEYAVANRRATTARELSSFMRQLFPQRISRPLAPIDAGEGEDEASKTAATKSLRRHAGGARTDAHPVTVEIPPDATTNPNNLAPAPLPSMLPPPIAPLVLPAKSPPHPNLPKKGPLGALTIRLDDRPNARLGEEPEPTVQVPSLDDAQPVSDLHPTKPHEGLVEERSTEKLTRREGFAALPSSSDGAVTGLQSASDADYGSEPATIIGDSLGGPGPPAVTQSNRRTVEVSPPIGPAVAAAGAAAVALAIALAVLLFWLS